MRIELGPVPEDAARWLPANQPDASDIGVNYADAFLKVFKKTLDDGRKITCKRRGLRITLTIGDAAGEALLRRIEHGPEVENILHQALVEAAASAGAAYAIEDGVVILEID